MKKTFWLWLLIFPVLLTAQEKPEVKNISADLGIGQHLSFGKISVDFLGIISDSRCPKDVTCIWPGEAKVLLGITENGKYFEKEVVIRGGGAEISVANDVLMQFSQLRPYPKTGVKIPADAYCMSFSAVIPKG
ncbi:hypothetical protein SAMN06296241_1050 [Salinimicrobium sediminis]|uniref:Uncharacterized protein n=1 Tax=Salinimicrobium sediminis TaxID=1343891 RepID=A0A285X2I1_9FLAO|nr:hypothetical protein [Salinimicrobium sediminis]SOC79525.1 hypothetical protein SAMN06296241_1050 [Salinimicrobium sediminis]